MKRFLKTFVFQAALIGAGTSVFSCGHLYAQKTKHFSFGASAGYGHLLNGGKDTDKFVKSHDTRMYSLFTSWRALPGDSSRYDEAFGYPSIEGGLIMADYSRLQLTKGDKPYTSSSGYVFGAYASFRREVLKSGIFSVEYSLDNGLGYCTKPYNKENNADNELIGSPVSIYFGAGTYAKFLIARQWELAAGVEFKHFSNGGLDRPNKGANTLGGSVRLRYYPQPQESSQRKHLPKEIFPKYFFCNVSVGWSVKSLLDEWLLYYYETPSSDPNFRTEDYPLHSALAVSVSPMFRYSRRFASGIGIDYMYAPYYSRIKELDQLRGKSGFKYDAHMLGLSLKHEVYYKKIALFMSIGYYLHKNMGHVAKTEEKPYYETVGLKYFIPKLNDLVYVGYDVKAHLLKAYSMEFHIGINLIPAKYR